jgi:hypothetical protein
MPARKQRCFAGLPARMGLKESSQRKALWLCPFFVISDIRSCPTGRSRKRTMRNLPVGGNFPQRASSDFLKWT